MAGQQQAAALLLAGQLVAVPTETVYGLAADATQPLAVAAIYAAKGRPQFNPLIAHVPDLAAAQALVDFDPLSRQLAEAFWPGPLTLVLPRRPDCVVAELAGSGLDTLAVRVPRQPDLLAVLRLLGRPIVAPSANRSGQLSPTTAGHVRASLAGQPAVAAVLDGGPCPVGVESTVVQVVEGQAWLLRAGGLPLQDLEAVCGPLHRARSSAEPRAPGQLAVHYAPKIPLRYPATAVLPGEALLTFAGQTLPGAVPVVARDLSPAGDSHQAAAALFALLHELDQTGASGIAAVAIPAGGLGEAIADRLTRAAAATSSANLESGVRP